MFYVPVEESGRRFDPPFPVRSSGTFLSGVVPCVWVITCSTESPFYPNVCGNYPSPPFREDPTLVG